ncbi:MAG: hypothetical protein P1U89_06835 [Verrucomicrobiales bacterium]|nr:hypothetical protein [Verrucomicrobiales bacterium]
MFSKKPTNRKRNHRRHKPLPRKAVKTDSLESLREREFQLNAQIGELEEVLAAREKEEDLRRNHVLPPQNSRISHSNRDLSFAEQRRLRKERNSSGLYFFILLAIASALAFWLFYTGG